MTDFSRRFGGTQRLYGATQTDWLNNAHFCVIGIGGVGCWAAEALARTAVGQISLIDLDDICLTNTNRQIHALSSTVGKAKVSEMAERIQAINPDAKVNPIEDFVTAENVSQYINIDFDYVIEATDSIKAKAAIIDYCKRNKISVVTVGGAGGQIDPSKICVGDLAKTIQDPLAAKLRSELRRNYRFSSNPKRRFGVDCVYSTEQLRYPQADGTVCHQKSMPDGSVKLDCNNGFGSATVVTASFGMQAAAVAINKFIDKRNRQTLSQN